MTKPAPSVFPATPIPRHYLRSTPLPLSTASARGSRSSHWILVKKVLAGQETFADWLGQSDSTDHCWVCHAASPFLGTLLGVSFLLPFYSSDFHKTCWNLMGEISSFLPNFKWSSTISVPWLRITGGCTQSAASEHCFWVTPKLLGM